MNFENIDLSEHILHWRKNTPPPDDNLGKFDTLVTVSFNYKHKGARVSKIVCGFVGWNRGLSRYYFQYVEQDEKGVYKPCNKVFTNLMFKTIKTTLEKEWGIVLINGILNEKEVMSGMSKCIN